MFTTAFFQRSAKQIFSRGGTGAAASRMHTHSKTTFPPPPSKNNETLEAISKVYVAGLIFILPINTTVFVLSSKDFSPLDFVTSFTSGIFVGVTYPISYPMITIYTMLNDQCNNKKIKSE